VRRADDMTTDEDHDPRRRLPPDKLRAWITYMRLYLRLSYEINRQLQADSDVSLADYHVLTALQNSEGQKQKIHPLAAMIGWERSRLSHHVRRMESRGLVICTVASDDRRATEVALSPHGRDLLDDSMPAHLAHIDDLFFGGLPADLLAPLTEALEAIYLHILENGSLPAAPGSTVDLAAEIHDLPTARDAS
jgi:DNA-binding MarR family transcriptional regulator